MAGTTLSQGSSVTLTVAATDSILIDSNSTGTAVIEAVSGVTGAANAARLVDHRGGQAVYGPFGAGTVKLSAVGGAITYMQGSAPLTDEGGFARFQTDASGNVTGLVGPDGKNVLDIQPAYVAYSGVTPTHYVDPSASTSSGAGTLANPFTTAAQVTSFVSGLSGNLAGVVLGIKRGTTLRGGGLTLQDVYGSATKPFILLPYGDAEAKPIITAMEIRTNWSPVSGGVFVLTGVSAFAQAWHLGQSDRANFRRYWGVAWGADEAATIAAMLAAGRGVQSYDSSGQRLYIYPYDGDNPNLGQVEVCTGTNALKLVYRNVAASGYLNVSGIEVRGANDSALNVAAPGSTGSISTISDVTISDCVCGMAGVDHPSTGGSDAILAYGVSDTLRMTRLVISGNQTFKAMNCAVEIGAQTGALVEWNNSYETGGPTVAELWFSCSDCKIQYNVGKGDLGTTGNLKTFGDRGVWITGWTTVGGASPDATKNTGNTIAFNAIYNVKGPTVEVTHGNNQVITNNTLIGGDHTGGTPVAQLGPSTNTTSFTFTNNLVVGALFGSGANLIFGGTNSTWNGGSNNWYVRNVDGGISNHYRGTTYTAGSSWQTAVSGDANSIFGEVVTLRKETRVLPGHRSLRSGVAVSGFVEDLAGNPIGANAWPIGAYGREP